MPMRMDIVPLLPRLIRSVHYSAWLCINGLTVAADKHTIYRLWQTMSMCATQRLHLAAGKLPINSRCIVHLCKRMALAYSLTSPQTARICMSMSAELPDLLVLCWGKLHSQKLPSCLQPSRLVELLLSAGHLLFHVLPESACLRNGVSILTVCGIHIHKVRVLGAPAPPKILDLHDLHATRALQPPSKCCLTMHPWAIQTHDHYFSALCPIASLTPTQMHPDSKSLRGQQKELSPETGQEQPACN